MLRGGGRGGGCVNVRTSRGTLQGSAIRPGPSLHLTNPALPCLTVQHSTLNIEHLLLQPLLTACHRVNIQGDTCRMIKTFHRFLVLLHSSYISKSSKFVSGKCGVKIFFKRVFVRLRIFCIVSTNEHEQRLLSEIM